MSEQEDNPSIAALFWEVRRRLVADEAIPLAGNIAFRIVFSAFPFLIFLTALAGFIGNADWAERAVNFLLSVAPEALVKPLTGEIKSILTVPRGGLLSVAALLTVWSAMGGVDSVRVGLNRAYNVQDHRSIWLLYAIDVLFVVATAAILLAVALLIVFFPIGLSAINTYSGGLPPALMQVDQYRFPLAMLLLIAGVYAAHRILPAKRLYWRDVLPGVLLTVIAWIAMAAGFSYWLLHFNSFASTYASLSGIFAAMFFVYMAALLLILGGELNRVLQLVKQRKINHQANKADTIGG
jgi:membrane protein